MNNFSMLKIDCLSGILNVADVQLYLDWENEKTN
jgi:hypothetical protein